MSYLSFFIPIALQEANLLRVPIFYANIDNMNPHRHLYLSYALSMPVTEEMLAGFRSLTHHETMGGTAQASSNKGGLKRFVMILRSFFYFNPQVFTQLLSLAFHCLNHQPTWENAF